MYDVVPFFVGRQEKDEEGAEAVAVAGARAPPKYVAGCIGQSEFLRRVSQWRYIDRTVQYRSMPQTILQPLAE